MKKVAFALLALIAFACDEHETTYSVQPELEPYVTTFYNEAQERGVTLPKNLVAEISTRAQSVANTTTLSSQNYLYVSPDVFNHRTANGMTTMIEADVYKALTELFMNRRVNFGYTGVNREVEFNEAFN